MMDIIPSDDMGIYARVSSQEITDDLVYFGSKGSGDTRFLVGNNIERFYHGWNNYTPSTDQTYILTNELLTIKMNYLNIRKNYVGYDSKERNLSTLGDNLYPIVLFTGNNAGTVRYYSEIKLYGIEIEISQGNTVEYTFISCYRKSDGVVGLYDTINDAFYTNSGTGEFIKGELES